MRIVRCTLVFLFDTAERVLLGYKKRGFGKDKWNGFGGKIEPNENKYEAAVREVKEECNLTVDVENVRLLGLLHFNFVGEDLFYEVNVFKVNKFSGEVKESEEMRPAWFHVNDIPFDKMWKDDYLWYPLLLKNKYFYGKFDFKGDHTMLSHDVAEKISETELDKLRMERSK